MAFNIPGMPFRPTGADVGAFDLGGAIKSGLGNYQQGVAARYAPQMMEAQINELKGRAQKNMMMGQLLQSLIGGGEAAELGANTNNNLKAAMIKGLTGIDLYTRSPEETANLKKSSAVETAAEKKNIETGVADIGREEFQEKAKMPPEYLSPNGSALMAKDLLAYKFGDKAAGERLVNAAVAHKGLPELGGYQLGSLGQKSTVPALMHQKEANTQGWAKLSNFITNHMPSELHEKANQKFNELVKSTNRKREAFLSGGGKRAEAAERLSPKSSKKYSWSDISHTAKSRGMTENEVIDRLAQKNNMSVDEFMNLVESRSK